MKQRKVLSIAIKTKMGETYNQLLLLSEARLISQIAQEHVSVTVKAIEITEDQYKAEFGK